jgi:hypothetical protein
LADVGRPRLKQGELAKTLQNPPSVAWLRGWPCGEASLLTIKEVPSQGGQGAEVAADLEPVGSRGDGQSCPVPSMRRKFRRRRLASELEAR